MSFNGSDLCLKSGGDSISLKSSGSQDRKPNSLSLCSGQPPQKLSAYSFVFTKEMANDNIEFPSGAYLVQQTYKGEAVCVVEEEMKNELEDILESYGCEWEEHEY